MASVDFRTSARAAETGDAWLPLITISHAAFADRHITSDADIVSRGARFRGYPLSLSLPKDTDDGMLDGGFEVEDVNRNLIDAIRTANSPPTVLIEIVRAAAPGIVEFTYSSLELTDIDIDGIRLAAVVGLADFRTEPIPADAMTPTLFPGLY